MKVDYSLIQKKEAKASFFIFIVIEFTIIASEIFTM